MTGEPFTLQPVAKVALSGLDAGVQNRVILSSCGRPYRDGRILEPAPATQTGRSEAGIGCAMP